ncbi:hypothetical protein [Tumebacillus flagellatus]|uniref:Uncharacterized protein n=1 Tax=Tumebacillus flagellatus TaxID=1157490 RepID=A0A074LM54_9BACL|nr:hypothetical protein [Tumebacillus flagellatus]KEO80978.1 hypothetical protein EL26_23130 [Tumebacillus flagellatus]
MSVLRALSWRHVLFAAFWCAVVVLVNFSIAEFAYGVLHAFWLSLFLVGFLPVWLACYGMMFASKWLWRELSVGVFGAVCLVSWALTHEMEGARYRLLMALTFGVLAVFAMTLGYWTERLFRSLLADGSARGPRKTFWS